MRPRYHRSGEAISTTDVHVVRRTWQAAGIVEVSAKTKARAERLVSTWMERGRAS